MPKIIIEQLTPEQKKELAIPDQPQSRGDWSYWECNPSTFDWYYSQTEYAYVYEGKIKVKTAEGDVDIKAGDYVSFPKGLRCTWNVKEKIRKVYRFE